jgi:uncharacterized protein (DUF1810 family)
MPDLQRFIIAQDNSYDTALSEITNGRKKSHWMWYIFPQVTGLGNSEYARKYAIKDLPEAEEYLAHPVLGSRLIEISKATLAIEGRTASQIFGSPDDMKLHSCMTLFSMVDNADPVFNKVIDKYYNGRPDAKTTDIITLNKK